MNKEKLETSHITLKWGTLKGCNLKTDKEIELGDKYVELGCCISCAMQRDTIEQKKIICQLIDECNNPDGIFLDWESVYVSKDEAKKYVMEYRNE